jgi:hypothetical protein
MTDAISLPDFKTIYVDNTLKPNNIIIANENQQHVNALNEIIADQKVTYDAIQKFFQTNNENNKIIKTALSDINKLIYDLSVTEKELHDLIKQDQTNVDALKQEIIKLKQNVTTLNTEIQQKNLEIQQKNSQIQQKDQEIQTKNTEIQQKIAEIQLYKENIVKFEQDIEQKKKDIEQKELLLNEIQKIKEMLSQNNQNIVKYMQNDIHNKSKAEIESIIQQIKQKITELTNKTNERKVYTKRNLGGIVINNTEEDEDMLTEHKQFIDRCKQLRNTGNFKVLKDLLKDKQDMFNVTNIFYSGKIFSFKIEPAVFFVGNEKPFTPFTVSPLLSPIDPLKMNYDQNTNTYTMSINDNVTSPYKVIVYVEKATLQNEQSGQEYISYDDYLQENKISNKTRTRNNPEFFNPNGGKRKRKTKKRRKTMRGGYVYKGNKHLDKRSSIITKKRSSTNSISKKSSAFKKKFKKSYKKNSRL